MPKIEERNLRPIAEDVLRVFDAVESSARSQLKSGGGISADTIVPANTFTTPGLLGTLRQMADDRVRAAQVLVHEPAVARVQARNRAGQVTTYFISRVMPPTVAGTVMVSYRAPAGAMAARDVGDEFVLPNGDVLEICSKLQLRPLKQQQLWDSVESRYADAFDPPLSIDSLRALLGVSEAEAEDLLEAILAEEGQSKAVREGLQRALLTKMGLRDQPVLDRFQDRIFRLPVASRLLLLGPPGTGKTTTLIRRLGQKLEGVHLDEAEVAQVARMEAEGLGALSQAWVMFTPTRLLQQYVKEAFAREGVPASEQQIRTWTDHRRRLSRDVLRILRGPGGGGPFVLKDDLPSLLPSTQTSTVGWYGDFDGWQKQRFLGQLLVAAEELARADDPTVAALAARPVAILKAADAKSLDGALVELTREAQVIRERVAELKQGTDSKVKEALIAQLNRDRGFLVSLAAFMASLQEPPDADADDLDDGEEADDVEADEEPSRAEQVTAQAAAAQAYMRALRAQARAHARRRSVRKGSRNARIIEWIADRGLAASVSAAVGASLVMQSNARRLALPVGRYLWGLPLRYREFRRQASESDRWYRREGYGPRDLHPHELDLLALAMLRSASGLLQRPGVRAAIDDAGWASVRGIRDQMKMQVLVDEATDFSALQLGCMSALAHPESRSFFACGDFNQRLTSWGVRSQAELEWACAGLKAERVTISYRQSQQLNEFAKGLVAVFGGDEAVVQLPPGVNSSAVAPVLAENLHAGAATAEWIALRVTEITRMVRQLPSVAVLVVSEQAVEPMADLLREALAGANVAVEACKDGQVVGTGESVRVFDVQHIKGLEFEAVIFVDVDTLAKAEPDLFDRYLYVGATRAATYLGLTCGGSLPKQIEALRPHFGDSWA